MGTGEYGKLINLDIPEFIFDIVEKVIKESINDMKGFTSLRALYVYEQSERLESELNSVSDENTYSEYINMINLLRNDAYCIEYEDKSNGYQKRYSK